MGHPDLEDHAVIGALAVLGNRLRWEVTGPNLNKYEVVDAHFPGLNPGKATGSFVFKINQLADDNSLAETYTLTGVIADVKNEEGKTETQYSITRDGGSTD